GVADAPTHPLGGLGEVLQRSVRSVVPVAPVNVATERRAKARLTALELRQQHVEVWERNRHGGRHHTSDRVSPLRFRDERPPGTPAARLEVRPRRCSTSSSNATALSCASSSTRSSPWWQATPRRSSGAR